MSCKAERSFGIADYNGSEAVGSFGIGDYSMVETALTSRHNDGPNTAKDDSSVAIGAIIG